jgi:peptide/nickel transport system permease protein
VQRSIEILRSLPELPIWLALSAAIPATWGPVAVFFMISIILGLLDWPGLARAVRSKFLALREEDYVRAAELMGASSGRIISAHMMPNFMSHLVASATLSIPGMILGETALSLLGLGLRPPAVSWGLMLNDALDLTAVEIYPWLLTPMIPVMMVVLAFSFFGDGLRDALDPYS